MHNHERLLVDDGPDRPITHGDHQLDLHRARDGEDLLRATKQ
jgi:hypothetical protein